MKGAVKKLVDVLVAVLLPRVLKEVVHCLEEMLQADIDGDGSVGWGKDVKDA